jgi:recombination protein RecT
MSVDEVCEIRDNSQGYLSAKKYGKASPWDSHFNEMAKKTVIRRLFKYLPVSVEIQRAVGLDEQADAGVVQGNGAVIDGDFSTFDDLDEQVPETKTDAVKDKLRKQGNVTPADVDPETGEVIEVSSAAGFSADDVLLMIKTAEDSDSLDAACDLIRDLSAADAKKARAEAAKKRKQLEG